MGLRVKQYEDAWYFSKFGFGGLGVERTLAVYKPQRKELTITKRGFKQLNGIFRYLRRHLTASKITVVWHREEKQ